MKKGGVIEKKVSRLNECGLRHTGQHIYFVVPLNEYMLADCGAD